LTIPQYKNLQKSVQCKPHVEKQTNRHDELTVKFQICFFECSPRHLEVQPVMQQWTVSTTTNILVNAV